MTASVLIVDDEKSFRVIAEEALQREGYSVRTAASGAAGARAWREEPADVVILDRNLPDQDGVDVLEALAGEAAERRVDTLFLVATAYADVENAVLALRLGAEDYLTKPIQLPDLLIKIRKALEARRLRNRVRALQERTPGNALLTTSNAAMRELLERAQSVAESPSTSVLLQGESGTGKEVLARFIHRRTAGRGEEAFVELNCAAIAEGLLESELFGHERGAFTDAKESKRGLLELAHGGTLFLDEVGELGPSLQAKLLRALETTTYRRVGGTRDLVADVRIIAATNRDLAQEVRAGRFRLDLFHRLDVFHLTLPPLRERPEDIVPLARWLLQHIAQRLLKPSRPLSPQAEAALVAYSYPGNVRELRNALERAVILEKGPSIGPAALSLGGGAQLGPFTGPGNSAPAASALATAGALTPTGSAVTPSNGALTPSGGAVTPSGGAVTPAGGTATAGAAFFSVELDAEGRPPTLQELEKRYVEKLLGFAAGNKTQVARLLDVSYPTVAKKIADYGIKGSG